MPLYVLPAGLWEGTRDPPPYFEVRKHKTACLKSELHGYQWVFAPVKGSQWLKLGYDITLTGILNRVLNIGKFVVQTHNTRPFHAKY